MTIPVFLLGKNGEEAGINWRQCTKNYKIDPIRKEVQRQLGVRPRQVLPGTIRTWRCGWGITMDEFMRVKPSRNWWITHRFPFIDDVPMTRQDCMDWFTEQYPDRTLGRSACVGCPFRDSSSWLEIKATEPELFHEAVGIDESLRSDHHNAGQMFRKQAFLHHRRLPLMEAITLDVEQLESNGFINECEGHCGL